MSARTVARTVALVGAVAVLTWFVGVRRRANRRAVIRRRLEHLVASDRDRSRAPAERVRPLLTSP